MNISKIAVHGLFDTFTHDLALNDDERVTIIFGPNGIGKTMILRTLHALFNSSIRRLGDMPFREVNLTFDDQSRLKVARTPDQPYPQLSYETSAGLEHSFTPQPQELPFPTSAIDDFIPHVVQIGPSEWRDRETGEFLDVDDILNAYGDFLPLDADQQKQVSVLPPWLEDIRTSIPVRFIDTERLTDYSSYDRRLRTRHVYAPPAPERTVRRYSDDLARRVQQTLTEYATLSQSLDRSFPARLVVEPTTQPLSIDQLSKELALVEERRTELVAAGLLVQEQATLSVPHIDTIDDSRRSVLAVYAQDARHKLSVFDDLYARVNTFIRIANARLLYKHLSVGQNGWLVSNSEGIDLELEMLSSGEQHELVLLFDLLFRTKSNSLILVDEPELSLHVAWQREMLKDLQEMALLSDFRALLATHSPQIIGDRWDLTIELQGPTET